jgi:diguanylate cyclase (GGDEF)-like protein
LTVVGAGHSPEASDNDAVLGPGLDREQAFEHAVAVPPALEAADEQRRTAVLRSLLWTFVALTAAIAVIGLVAGSAREAAISATGGAVYGLLLLLRRRLGTEVTAYLCTFWYFALAAGAMVSGRGIHDVTIVLFPAGIFMGAMLVKRKHLVPLIILAVAAVAAIGLARIVWHDPRWPQSQSPVAEVVVVALLLLVAGVLTRLVVRGLQAMVAERQWAERALLQSKQELEARNEALEVVNNLASRLQRTLEIEAIAGETVDALVQHSQPPRVAFYLLAPDGSRLRLVAAHGFTEEERNRGAVLPVDGSLSGVAMREQRLVTSNDVGHDLRAEARVRSALAERGVTSALCVPLVFGGEPLGTVNLVFEERRSFSQAELDAFRAIGQAVALAITNARHVKGLEHQAFHDALTGLPNRASLHRRFAALAAVGRNDGRVGLVLLDLISFRAINEAIGHQAGDVILTRIGERLAEVRLGRRSEVFRLGGDEFAVLLPGIGASKEAEAAAHTLLAVTRQPIEVEGMALEVGASAGVAVYPDHAGDSRELLRCADVAMYRSKRTAARVAVYAHEIDEHTPERLALMVELAKAIREGELVLHFQPKVALASGAVVGFEALVRWPHPRLGLLLPEAFLPSAEGSDVVHPLTYWVVEHAVAQLARWNEVRPDLTMAINLSVRILLDTNCSQRLEEIIRRIGVDPSRVEFELTETAILADPGSASTMLRRITATGARLAIDDFGTGYSSLTYLTRFPVHAIKIDRSFVSDMATGEQSRAIVRSTVQLARSLGLGVVAEGIEDRATVDALREIGCEQAQGYYFGAPAPAEALGRMLAERWSLPHLMGSGLLFLGFGLGLALLG